MTRSFVVLLAFVGWRRVGGCGLSSFKQPPLRTQGYKGFRLACCRDRTMGLCARSIAHGFHPSAALVACHSLVGCKSAWAAGCTSCRALGPSCRVLLCALCTKSFILPTPYTLRATRRVSSRYEPHRRRAYLKYSMGDEARRVVEEGDGCRRGPWRITVRSAMGNYVCSCIVRGCLDLPPWRSELPRAPPPADIPCRD